MQQINSIASNTNMNCYEKLMNRGILSRHVLSTSKLEPMAKRDFA